jgi:hypothetical protein
MHATALQAHDVMTSHEVMHRLPATHKAHWQRAEQQRAYSLRLQVIQQGRQQCCPSVGGV